MKLSLRAQWGKTQYRIRGCRFGGKISLEGQNATSLAFAGWWQARNELIGECRILHRLNLPGCVAQQPYNEVRYVRASMKYELPARQTLASGGPPKCYQKDCLH